MNLLFDGKIKVWTIIFLALFLLLIFFLVFSLYRSTEKTNKEFKKSKFKKKIVLLFKEISKKNESLKLAFMIVMISYICFYFTYLIGVSNQYPVTDGNLFGTSDGWIGFTGAVVGGILTLIGVILTINEQRILREKDEAIRNEEQKDLLSIQFKPILSYASDVSKLSKQSDGSEFTYALFFTDKEKISSLSNNGFLIDISNLGRGEADITKAEYDNSKMVGTFKFHSSKGFDSSKFLVMNKSLTLLICLIPMEKITTVSTCSLDIIFYYTDLLERRKYKYTVVLEFQVNPPNNVKEDKYTISIKNIGRISHTSAKESILPLS